MKPKTINYGNSLISLAPDEASKGWIFDDALLLYLLKCVEDRGWKSHLFTNERGVSVCTIVVDEDNEFNSEYYTGLSEEKESRTEVVLYAYVKALAAQRKIAERSSWQHFKGDRVDVKCFASWSSGVCLLDKDRKDAGLYGSFQLEEESEKKVQLWKQDGVWVYAAGWGVHAGDRVFYTHDGKGWARLKNDFLGVVGPKYPEMEGCLRFVKVGDE